ncbi:hypothetical protein [uncultured Flavobacterium sp.]|uniref:hypothetical protein n=1 Tax=uncultured Flavobacterium sp. TaxID=165435 RepID=UPI0025D6A5DE|nr:hypothetical protein [uncultured Flavobacterium sp.]
MENNNYPRKEKKLVTSRAQAKTVLHMLFEDSEKQELARGISSLLDQLRNPELDVLLDRYPELLQEYDLAQLLSGSLEVTDAKMHDVKTAGLLSCLQLLLHFCRGLKENPDPMDKRFDSLRYILSSISSDKFVHDLLLTIISAVGAGYYEKFQQHIQDLDLSLENARGMEKDPELQEHLELMAWFGLVRLFLEAAYAYFDISDEDLKIILYENF